MALNVCILQKLLAKNAVEPTLHMVSLELWIDIEIHLAAPIAIARIDFFIRRGWDSNPSASSEATGLEPAAFIHSATSALIKNINSS